MWQTYVCRSVYFAGMGFCKSFPQDTALIHVKIIAIIHKETLFLEVTALTIKASRIYIYIYPQSVTVGLLKNDLTFTFESNRYACILIYLCHCSYNSCEIWAPRDALASLQWLMGKSDEGSADQQAACRVSMSSWSRRAEHRNVQLAPAFRCSSSYLHVSYKSWGMHWSIRWESWGYNQALRETRVLLENWKEENKNNEIKVSSLEVYIFVYIYIYKYTTKRQKSAKKEETLKETDLMRSRLLGVPWGSRLIGMPCWQLGSKGGSEQSQRVAWVGCCCLGCCKDSVSNPLLTTHCSFLS